MFLDGGQQSGAVGVADFSRVEVVLWVQQLKARAHTQIRILFFACVCVLKKTKKPKCLGIFSFVHLVSCGHDGHHGELVHADLGHSHRSQQADLRWTHVCALGQHALPSPDVMSDRPTNARAETIRI